MENQKRIGEVTVKKTATGVTLEVPKHWSGKMLSDWKAENQKELDKFKKAQK